MGGVVGEECYVIVRDWAGGEGRLVRGFKTIASGVELGSWSELTARSLFARELLSPELCWLLLATRWLGMIALQDSL